MLYDLITLRSILSLIDCISVSLRATINGILHYGRGFQYCEKQYCFPSTNNHIPTNPLNNLSERWFHKQQISSWCKIGDDVYGQLNYFFKPSCIVTDKFVSNLLIASITLRRVTIPDYKSNDTPPILCINLKRSLNNKNVAATSWKISDQCFINAKSILPTRVASIGFSRYKDPTSHIIRYLPIHYSNTPIPQSVRSTMKDIIFQGENIIIGFLALIQVNPEKLKEDETINIQTIQEMNNFD